MSKQYKWEVKPGGTVGLDSAGMKHAISQTGAASVNLGIAKSEGVPTVTTDSFVIAGALNAPKAEQNLKFDKAGGQAGTFDAQAMGIAGALNAPKAEQHLQFDKSGGQAGTLDANALGIAGALHVPKGGDELNRSIDRSAGVAKK